MWGFRGDQRPKFAINPRPGQESVWDYPRPPVCKPDGREIIVRISEDQIVAKTINAVRVLETASPPTVYIPSEDINWDFLRPGRGSSYCEWKGQASYWDLMPFPNSAQRIPAAAWSYPNPTDSFLGIKNYVSFYPAKVQCLVDGEMARPQEGGFYGGWVTNEIVGPYKGQPGTLGW